MLNEDRLIRNELVSLLFILTACFIYKVIVKTKNGMSI